jgi:TolB protein
VGTIAYPVFNGANYNLHFGNVDGSGSRVFQTNASQPAFNADGSRIAFHSWSGDRRGLVTMDTSGANGVLISTFIEDQLPTWTAGGKDVIILTRRSGGRQSELYRLDSYTERDQGASIGEGEYPTIGANGQLTFKGWGSTAFGLRIASENLEEIETITSVDEDTAPALSPDGSKIAFMSRREGHWDIYIVNSDGSDLKRLTVDGADDGLPAWSPDGNAIAFVSNRGGPWAIWAMTPDGAGQRQLFTMEGTPDGFVGTDTYASRGWAEERISWTDATFEVE